MSDHVSSVDVKRFREEVMTSEAYAGLALQMWKERNLLLEEKRQLLQHLETERRRADAIARQQLHWDNARIHSLQDYHDQLQLSVDKTVHSVSRLEGNVEDFRTLLSSVNFRIAECDRRMERFAKELAELASTMNRNAI